MPDVFASLSRLLDWRSILDVALVTVVIYAALRLFRGTQAVQLLRGVLIVAIFIALLSLVADLPAFNWLLRNSVPMVLVAIPVIFQPELRRALERLGRSSPLLNRRGDTTTGTGCHQRSGQGSRLPGATAHGCIDRLSWRDGLGRCDRARRTYRR